MRSLTAPDVVRSDRHRDFKKETNKNRLPISDGDYFKGLCE